LKPLTGDCIAATEPIDDFTCRRVDGENRAGPCAS
jgi:hypothetical protein